MAVILSGKELSEKLTQQQKQRVAELKARGIYPGLAVVLVGEDPASTIYVRNKGIACETIGIYSETIRPAAGWLQSNAEPPEAGLGLSFCSCPSVSTLPQCNKRPADAGGGLMTICFNRIRDGTPSRCDQPLWESAARPCPASRDHPVGRSTTASRPSRSSSPSQRLLRRQLKFTF